MLNIICKQLMNGSTKLRLQGDSLGLISYLYSRSLFLSID